MIAISSILIGLNSLVYVSNAKGFSPDWFRVDLTATKEYQLSNQALSAIEHISEDTEALIFLRNDSPADGLAIKRAEDLLSEFSKNSNFPGTTAPPSPRNRSGRPLGRLHHRAGGLR